MTRANTAADYEERVERSGDCHLWTGACNHGGYGEFRSTGLTCGDPERRRQLPHFLAGIKPCTKLLHLTRRVSRAA